MEKGVPIRSITRSIAALKAINRHGSLSMMEIAKASQVPYPTACRIVHAECTRTLENSTDAVMSEPSTTQPPEMMTFAVSPWRPCSSGTNFAGGNCSW